MLYNIYNMNYKNLIFKKLLVYVVKKHWVALLVALAVFVGFVALLSFIFVSLFS